jgi:hypothetical protein
VGSRSQNDTRVGSMVSSTTASSSVEPVIQVDLVAQAGGERLDGLCGVVLASVEAAINRGLDTPPSRAKDRRCGQRCPDTSPQIGPMVR